MNEIRQRAKLFLEFILMLLIFFGMVLTLLTAFDTLSALKDLQNWNLPLFVDLALWIGITIFLYLSFLKVTTGKWLSQFSQSPSALSKEEKKASELAYKNVMRLIYLVIIAGAVIFILTMKLDYLPGIVFVAVIGILYSRWYKKSQSLEESP